MGHGHHLIAKCFRKQLLDGERDVTGRTRDQTTVGKEGNERGAVQQGEGQYVRGEIFVVK